MHDTRGERAWRLALWLSIDLLVLIGLVFGLSGLYNVWLSGFLHLPAIPEWVIQTVDDVGIVDSVVFIAVALRFTRRAQRSWRGDPPAQ